MDFSNYKFRCSSLGYIMTDAKGDSNLQKLEKAIDWQNVNLAKYAEMKKELKTAQSLWDKIQKNTDKINYLKTVKDVPHLSDTCKTHLADIYTSVVYNRHEDIKSKYLEKGIMVEEDAITLYSLVTGNFYKKNKERKENDYITGELDFFDDIYVIDTKSNWSIYQFTRTVARPIKPMYKWQLKGYMILWNMFKSKLAYCLLNTPEHLIQREISKLKYELFGNSINYDMSTDDDKIEFAKAVEELRRNHIYDDIPDNEKIRIYEEVREDDDEERISLKVEDCRIYLNNIATHTICEDEEDEIAA